MKVYNIAGIQLEFDYISSKYFAGRIDKYVSQKSHQPTYKMHCRMVSMIEKPSEEATFIHQTREVYEGDGYRTIYTYDKAHQTILSLVTHSYDFKHVDIQFNSIIESEIPEKEYITTGIYFFEMALREGLVPLHASAIQLRDEAILFSAPSGTGKSTQANLWKSIFPEVTFINDDKPLIKTMNEEVWVMGTPWSGKTALNDNQSVRLKGIFFIKQSNQNKVIQMSDKEKLIAIYQNTYRPSNDAIQDQLFKSIDYIIKYSYIHQLLCTVDKEAVDVAYRSLYHSN